MTTIRIPAPLRSYAGGASSVQVSGGTVAEALDDLGRQYPDLRQHIFNGDEVRGFVNLYLNKEDIKQMDGLQTSLGEDDTLLIIPSVAGG